MDGLPDLTGTAEQLRFIARTRAMSRRAFLRTAAVGAVLATDLGITGRIAHERSTHTVQGVGSAEADALHPTTSWLVLPGFKLSWEESQWVLASLAPAMVTRGRLAWAGYSNEGLEIAALTRAALAYATERGITSMLLYGHSFGGMVAVQLAVRLRRAGLAVPLIVLDSTPHSRLDVLNSRWFDGLAYSYELGYAIPSTVRAAMEFGERVANKNERTWQQIADQTAAQLSPLAPSNTLIQSESAYIYNYDAGVFANDLGSTAVGYLGNAGDDTVDAVNAAAGWADTLPRNLVPPLISTAGARPAHASPQWNPQLYQQALDRLCWQCLPVPRAIGTTSGTASPGP
ncbi:alpha/beta fold hydrolase [Tersicoccus sp. Bi-70]|uniref:alpha/beta fold hydrolase n=1 Tax=Tersicoccus sp. Bi-70 TaxID=1897634 RepID=UPI0009FA0928|nr:alpha/beta hydrolase [Tersicoccus sp. Bi-70]